MIDESRVPALQDNLSALIISEHTGMRRLLKLILCALAIEVDEASSEDEALIACGKVPRIVLVDLDPSFEHGMVLWHALRRNPRTSHIPSIFLIEAGNDFIRRLASTAGATICLSKPFHARDLRSSVEQLLGRHCASGMIDAAAHNHERERPL